MEEADPLPQILSSCSSGRRRSGDSNSPEFEFWMLRNPSFPQPNLLSADELFSDGFLLPLRLLNLSDEPTPAPPPVPATTTPESTGSDRVSESEANSTIESTGLSSTPPFTSSKRWMDIFKKGEKRNSRSFNSADEDDTSKEKDINSNIREKKREKINNGVGSGKAASTAELNINIWPFSRSRSAGNGGARPRSSAVNRKVSSAPCSRSNSSGESKSRKWPSSPSRGGVHLGRSSPVWQVRRGGSGRRSTDEILKNPRKGNRKDGIGGSQRTVGESSGGRTKARVLSLNVPMCIGYRQHFSCRSGENSAVVVATAAGGGTNGGDVSGEGGRGSNLFNIRSLFTKKVY